MDLTDIDFDSSENLELDVDRGVSPDFWDMLCSAPVLSKLRVRFLQP